MPNMLVPYTESDYVNVFRILDLPTNSDINCFMNIQLGISQSIYILVIDLA